jgi:hypothetical protein
MRDRFAILFGFCLGILLLWIYVLCVAVLADGYVTLYFPFNEGIAEIILLSGLSVLLIHEFVKEI